MLAYISALNCSHSYIFDFEICLDRWEFETKGSLDLILALVLMIYA